jgi:hypothetical protein
MATVTAAATEGKTAVAHQQQGQHTRHEGMLSKHSIVL